MSEPIIYDPDLHTVLGDGLVVDDAGEVVGRYDGSGVVSPLAGGVPPFAITCRADAEKHLARRQADEAALAAIEARRRAQNVNFNRQARYHKVRLAFDAKYRDPLLHEWARGQLVGKSRTVALDHGAISFRTTPERVEILDPVRAVEFVEQYAPDEVKKSVGVQAVNEAVQAFYQVNVCMPDLSAFARVKAAGESVTIRTGIKEGGKP